MQVLVGTSGYAYREWKGSFYPSGLADDRMLGHYASRLPAVEINNTFYRMPKESVVLAWADQVPDAFRFVLKASRRITHLGRLRGVESELEYFVRVSQALGMKRGPSLFQLPPNMKKDVDRLTTFLALLPRDWRAAFEFRHASWLDDEVFGALRERNLALCVADSEKLSTPAVATADYGYFRLRDEGYTPADIDRWAKTIAGMAPDWKETFVYFKHEDEGKGPEFAQRLKAALGMTTE